MKNTTRKHFSAYLAQLATLNGVESAAQLFTVTPGVQQKLESRIQESSAFLKSIGIYPVDEMQGQKIGIGLLSLLMFFALFNDLQRLFVG